MRIFVLIISFLYVQALSAQNLPKFLDVVKDSTYSVYCNVDKVIKIKPGKAEISLIDLKATGGNVVKQNDSTYQVRYYEALEEAKIKLYYKRLPVDILTLSVVKIPAPSITIDNYAGPNIPFNALQGIQKVSLNFENKSDMKLELFSCRVAISDLGKNPIVINLQNKEINEKLPALIKSLKKNATIRFDDFKVRTTQNYIFGIDGSPVQFTIVE